MASFSSAAAGAWDVAATWGGSTIPNASGDTVSIAHAVTGPAIDVNIGSGTLTVAAGGSLTWGATTLRCGNVSQTGSGTTNTGTGTWYVAAFTTAGTGATTVGAGNVYCTGAFTHGSSGALTLTGNVVQSSAVDSYALTTLAKVKAYLGISSTDDDAALSRLINAASDAIEKYCGRYFVTRTVAERCDGTGDRFLYLSHLPITAVTRISIGTQSAMTLTNSASDAYAAQASISATTLTLTVYGGASAGTSTLTLSSYADIDALVTAVNALGTGWTATAVPSYSDWAATELGKVDFMGRECFDGTVIYLSIPGEREADFEIYADEGCLYRPWGWPRGRRNVFVDYTGGYSGVPDDLEQATIEIVSRLWAEREHDPGLDSERLGDYAWTRTRAMVADDMRAKLAPYRIVPLGDGW